VAGAYRGNIVAASDRWRASGVIASPAEWMPASVVGPANIVRAKFYVYAGGQSNPSDLNQIPNMRLRVQNRFAVNSMLEVFNHINGDPEQAPLARELRPSPDPAKPSLYRVDFDPVDVPYLAQNQNTEGFQRAFESFSTDPQDNGFVAMTESVIGTYPHSAVPDSAPIVKAYATTASNAGDLAVFTVGEELLYNYVPSGVVGGLGTAEFAGTVPTHTAGPLGATLDSAGVPQDRVGIGSRNFNPDRNTNAYAQRVRLSEGRQYKARFHVLSTQQTNQQCQVRLRARSIKFAWVQKFEMGGSWGTDSSKTYPLNASNSIAQQALPGIGCLNPDKISANENGGWYTVCIPSPLSVDIRAEAAAGTPLSARMPNITAQPGSGVNSPSRRDLLFGFDLLDSISGGLGKPLEQGNFTIDRIEVRAYDQVPD
jgi:hypothetical protein